MYEATLVPDSPWKRSPRFRKHFVNVLWVITWGALVLGLPDPLYWKVAIAITAAPRNARRPVSKDLARRWLLNAEKQAGLPKLDGSLWHAYRRKWATARKGLPDVDVAAAGGWSDLTCLKTAYQQPDPATMYRVVSEPTELREVR